jgi:hypothetical protein
MFLFDWILMQQPESTVCPLAREIWLSHQPKQIEQKPCFACEVNLSE